MMLKLTILCLLSMQRWVYASSQGSETSQSSLNNLSLCSQTKKGDGTLIVNCSSSNLDKLVTVPPGDQMVVLDVSNNHIHKLDILFNDESFSKVIKMNLKRNKIQRISANIFKQLKALKSLDLSDNRLTEWNFPTEAYNSPNYSHDLDSLELSYNKIAELTASSFSITSGLTELNVSFNVLTKTEERAFDNLQYLRVLDLSHNKLAILPVKLFSKLTSLSYLYLSKNELLAIPSDVTILNLLDLSCNKITTVEETLSHVIYPHEVTLLGGNPFRCDCNLLWLKEFYDTREYLLKFIDVDKDKFIPVCEAPESLKGDMWDVIGDDVFECDEDAKNREIGQITLSDEGVDEPLTGTEEIGVTEFRVTDINSESVRLEWLISSGNLVTISYRAFGDKNRNQAAVLPATTTSFVLRHLKSNKPYIVCIAPTEKLSSDDFGKKEKCIEIMTAVEMRDINKIILLLSLMAETLFNHRFLIILTFSCIVVIVRIVYVFRNANKKEKQS